MNYVLFGIYGTILSYLICAFVALDLSWIFLDSAGGQMGRIAFVVMVFFLIPAVLCGIHENEENNK